MKRAYIYFPHGLGDAVQLTVALTHLKAAGWSVDVSFKQPMGFLGDLCQELRPNEQGTGPYDLTNISYWPDPDTAFDGSPATKAERFLYEVCGIEPQPNLCKYQVFPQDRSELVESFIRRELEDKPFVLLHHHGNSSRYYKHVSEGVIRRAVDRIIELGRVPVLLDWAGRSSLLKSPSLRNKIVHPDVFHPLWLSTGTGEPSSIITLARRADLCIGIDSGPGHLFGASGARTIILWTGHHPIHYYASNDNVLHVVPNAHATLLRGTAAARDAGLRFFQQHYQNRTYNRLETALPEIVTEQLAGQPADPPAADGLIVDGDCWVREKFREQDMVIIRDVYAEDCYRLCDLPQPPQFVVDVGAHVGAFARACRRRSTHTRIACVEANAENIPCLERNVAAFGRVFWSACTYEPGDVGLASTVFDGSENTGGSTVLPIGSEGWTGRRNGSRYQLDHRPLPKCTLERIIAETGWPRIDLLKLDCEGSEYSILENADLDRLQISTIVGEYHGGMDRFQALVQKRFASDWKIEILKGGDIGLFRLRRQAKQAKAAAR